MSTSLLIQYLVKYINTKKANMVNLGVSPSPEPVGYSETLPNDIELSYNLSKLCLIAVSN